MNKTMVELFAGVGGFRVGLEPHGFQTVYANQWEPGATKQWAYDCYNKRFPNSTNVNKDVATITDYIPEHNLLVGGFPCQDYSVAHSLSSAKGIEGKKGILWWSINEILEKKRPPFVLLENVDRLLKSPAKQRGRDFGIILSCLCSLGYNVEWRVINAADYGFVQRRRRTFIFATSVADDINFFEDIFPCKFVGKERTTQLPKDLVDLSEHFSFDFANSGKCANFSISTCEIKPVYEGKYTVLNDILQKDVPEKYYVADADIPKWQYMKGAKKIERTSSEGYKYQFSEGAIAYPDYLDRPARTMLTSEGTKNRSSHIIEDPETKRIRLLTPVECERIDGFPDNWTEGMPDRMRYFCMGNALVVGLIDIMGDKLSQLFYQY